jgi:PAS domain S-box-containing protein
MGTTFLQRQMRVLHLEDNETDHILVREMLLADGLSCEIEAVKTRADFESALRQSLYDLIISDFSLPSFDGLAALTLARELSPRTPFIFFSGTIGEEVAVETLKNGATDYVLKQRPYRLVGAVRNAMRSVHERTRLQRVEGELRQMEERLRIVARASNDVVWEWDIKTGKVWFSENFQDVFGFAREDIGARLENWQDLLHPDDRARVVAGLTRMLATGGRVWWSEHRLRRADGLYLHVYDRASAVYDAAGKPLRMVGVVIDMTERKKAEEKIREQATFLDKAQDAIIVCDLDRSVLYWNQGAERIYGWREGEVIGKNIRKLFFRETIPPQIEESEKNLNDRGEWSGELAEFTKDGRRVIVQARTTLIRDEQGHPKSLLIINTDITERRQLEEQFLRAQRMESLGALVGGIAHDLNNALVPIIVGVDILNGQRLSEDAASMLQTMQNSARRSAEMVKQMLLFARGGEAARMLVRGDQLVKEMGRIIGDTFPKSIQCRVQLEKLSWPVSGFPTQLHQVLLNLCVNARDAMPQGGKLTLSTANVKLTPAEAAHHKDAAPGNYLCITVADSGTGIPPEALDKIFQPFFTTKAPEKGTGLGLSTCQSIVKSHGGFITVQSRVGAGTEFKVFLPAAAGQMTEAVVVDNVAPPVGQGERILVVDDEASILAITRAALENYGYEVLTAGGGPEAINLLAQNADSISLVISDLAMPLMDGHATVMALRKIQPDLKVILASGSEKEMEDILKEIKRDAFIPKPFTKETLLKTVHEVLTGRGRQADSV